MHSPISYPNNSPLPPLSRPPHAPIIQLFQPAGPTRNTNNANPKARGASPFDAPWENFYPSRLQTLSLYREHHVSLPTPVLQFDPNSIAFNRTLRRQALSKIVPFRRCRFLRL